MPRREEVSRAPLPLVVMPTDDEVLKGVSATVPAGERVRYVKGLLRPALDLQRSVRNLEADNERLRESRDQMAEELRALRQKLGDLDPGSRNALDQRYDMLGKMTRARNEVDRLEADVKEALRRMRDALKK